jgi:CSLREA domain-containing protein
MRTVPSAFRLSPVAAALAVALMPAASVAATITVTTTADTVGGPSLSLRDAITQANTNCGSDTAPTIAFAFTGAGPFVIAPSSPLPAFNCSIAPVAFTPTIDGYTQPGSAANTSSSSFNATIKVVLDGGTVTSSFPCGLEFDNTSYGGNLTVRGLKVQNFSYAGGLYGACGVVNLYGNIFSGNNVGANPANGSTIGSASAADRNVFISNTEGLRVGGGVTVTNNFVGTLNGTTAVGNTDGIYVNGAADVSNNLISGNTVNGIHVFADYGGSFISNNTIGLNAAGGKLGNGTGIFNELSNIGTIQNNTISGNTNGGIVVQYSDNLTIDSNTIGESFPNGKGIDVFCGGYILIEDNTVSNNTVEGVILQGHQNGSIEFNTISGNGTTGLRFDFGTCYGGMNFSYGNTITGNKGDGVLLTGATVGNTISASSISGNLRRNINLNNGSGAGFLPNDVGDGDGGSNNQQNWPSVDSVVQNGTSTVINFTLDSNVGATYTIEFFSNSAAGGPAGESFLGSTTISLAAGPQSGSFTVASLVDNVSATATNQTSSDTSEFSAQKAAITAPNAILTPAAINFGNQLVGTQSTTRTVTVRSTGDQDYVINSFCYGGPDAGTGKTIMKLAPSLCFGGAFSCESTCELGTPYPKGTSCRITATFVPPFNSTFTDGVFLCDNSSAGFHQLALQGVGFPPPPVQVSPTSFDFGDIPVGGTSDPTRFNVKNISYGTINLVGITTTGEFDVTSNTCGTTIPPLGNCDTFVAFGPTISGDSAGTLDVVYEDPSKGDQGVQPATVILFPSITTSANLAGNGVSGGELQLPDAIEMGAAPVGGDQITQAVVLRNTGTLPVTVSSVTITAPFTLVNNGCTTPVAPSGNCVLVLGYQTNSPGSATGTLTIVSDASGGSGDIPVHATGQTSAAGLLTVSPATIGFGVQTIGSSSGPHGVTIRNIGGATASLSLATTSIDFLLAPGNCGESLAPQASCTANVTFRPLLGFGIRTGSFVVGGNAVNAPKNVNLGGTSCRPFAGFGDRTGIDSSCAP